MKRFGVFVGEVLGGVATDVGVGVAADEGPGVAKAVGVRGWAGRVAREGLAKTGVVVASESPRF